jgi:hypothetical protein
MDALAPSNPTPLVIAARTKRAHAWARTAREGIVAESRVPQRAAA